MINANQLANRIEKAKIKKKESDNKADKYLGASLATYKSGYWMGYLDALEDIDKENVLDWRQK